MIDYKIIAGIPTALRSLHLGEEKRKKDKDKKDIRTRESKTDQEVGMLLT